MIIKFSQNLKKKKKTGFVRAIKYYSIALSLLNTYYMSSLPKKTFKIDLLHLFLAVDLECSMPNTILGSSWNCDHRCNSYNSVICQKESVKTASLMSSKASRKLHLQHYFLLNTSTNILLMWLCISKCSRNMQFLLGASVINLCDFAKSNLLVQCSYYFNWWLPNYQNEKS